MESLTIEWSVRCIVAVCIALLNMSVVSYILLNPKEAYRRTKKLMGSIWFVVAIAVVCFSIDLAFLLHKMGYF